MSVAEVRHHSPTDGERVLMSVHEHIERVRKAVDDVLDVLGDSRQPTRATVKIWTDGEINQAFIHGVSPKAFVTIDAWRLEKQNVEGALHAAWRWWRECRSLLRVVREWEERDRKADREITALKSEIKGLNEYADEVDSENKRLRGGNDV